MLAADTIRIGELEFKDCVVTVSEKSMRLDEDGLIRAEVFSSYIIAIDIPGDMLRLSPLPPRLDEVKAEASLASESESDSDDELEDQIATQPAEKASGDTGASSSPAFKIPKDRYVAPEMAQWARIYRIGHDLLIPTHVNDAPLMLFILDTGSFANMISTRAARRVTKVSSDETIKIKGLSGEVLAAAKGWAISADQNGPGRREMTAARVSAIRKS